MPVALTRAVSHSIVNCELTHLEREPIDFARANDQHHGYVAALRELGCHVIELPVLHDAPDAVFVEDTAVVLPELAIITIPGAVSRRAEVETVATALQLYRPCVRLQAPAMLDGGDVLVIRKRVFIGISSRSNTAAVDQVCQILAPYDYATHGVELNDCLHLKTAVTHVGVNTVLLNPAWVNPALFADYQVLEVDEREPFAANGVLIGDVVLYPSAFPHTQQRLEAAGIKLKLVDASELAKAEGAVTCCSILVNEE